MLTGLVCNPITEARLDEGRSLSSLAKLIGVSKQYVSRAEHGTYSSLNANLLKYACEQLEIEPAEFINRYREFQNAIRKATIEEVHPNMLSRKGSVSPGHVLFSSWRYGYWQSVISFCNAFCIHPEIVGSYEEGSRSDMPGSLKTILLKCKVLDPNWIDDPTDLIESQNEQIKRIAKVRQ